MFVNAKDILSKEKLSPQQKVNYDSVLQKMVLLWQEESSKPKLLIHSCCAPCSTYVLEYLVQYAEITIFFANSNIHPRVEYEYRSKVQQKFIADFNARTGNEVKFIEAPYEPAEFMRQVAEVRDAPEGGERCHICYKMRLDLAALKAIELGFDYFASALTLSPKKNSKVINEVGFEIQEIFTVKYLPSDFKKNNGYKRSIEMCRDYDVYRQCYCGCIFAAKQQGINFKDVISNAKKGLEKLAKIKINLI